MSPYFVSELNAIHTLARPQKFTVKSVDLSDFTFRLSNVNVDDYTWILHASFVDSNCRVLFDETRSISYRIQMIIDPIYSLDLENQF